MSTEDEGRAESDVELVARALNHKIVTALTSAGSMWACHDCGEHGEQLPPGARPTWEEATGEYRRHNARAVLTALAGRLLPAGGDQLLVAAARREGWAQAIAALRDEAERRGESGLYGDGGFGMTLAADYLAALTEEGQ